MKDEKIKTGSKVEMHFRITLGNGFVADDTFDEEPLIFKSGDGSLVPALDEFLIGLQAEDEGQLILNPDQGYGFSDDANIFKVPKKEFSTDVLSTVISKTGEFNKGQIIGFETPSGDELAGAVIAIEGDQLVVDFNHPFAGQVVTFDVKILSVTGA